MPELYSRSNQHPDYPVCDWQYEVANEDTILGYHDWTLHKIESEDLNA